MSIYPKFSSVQVAKCATCKHYGKRLEKRVPGVPTGRDPIDYARCRLPNTDKATPLRHKTDWCVEHSRKQ